MPNLNNQTRVLLVVSPSPYAQTFGSQLRVKNLWDSLQRYCQPSLVLASVKEYDPAVLKITGEQCDLRAVYRLQPQKTGVSGLIKSELSSTYLNTHGFSFDQADRESFLKLADTFDAIWFHTLRIPNALGIYKLGKPTILDADDLLSQFHATAALNSKGFAKILSLKRAWQWRRRERQLLSRFDVVTVCSEDDKKNLGGSDRIRVIPNSFKANQSPISQKRTGAPTIGFVGLLTYEPNRDGLLWFLQKVWPLVLNKIPNARCRIAGKGSKELSEAFGSNVEGIGWLDEIGDEIRQWWITIVPVHVGGGTRVKIATAFSHGCPVVSTTLGAYGYEITNGKELLLADTPTDFAEACIKLILEPECANNLARNALAAFNRLWSSDAIAPKVAQAVEAACNLSPQ